MNHLQIPSGSRGMQKKGQDTRYFTVEITREMITEAQRLIPVTQVNRTIASKIDTLAGHLGEFVFAQYFYGTWRKHRVGWTKGEADFIDIEIKTSAFPMNNRLNLLVREDYARKRKVPFYVQIIIDVDSSKAEHIETGTTAFICGWATGEEVQLAPLKDFGSKFGGRGGYRCHYIPIPRLHPMKDFQHMYGKYQLEKEKGHF